MEDRAIATTKEGEVMIEDMEGEGTPLIWERNFRETGKGRGETTIATMEEAEEEGDRDHDQENARDLTTIGVEGGMLQLTMEEIRVS